MVKRRTRCVPEVTGENFGDNRGFRRLRLFPGPTRFTPLHPSSHRRRRSPRARVCGLGRNRPHFRSLEGAPSLTDQNWAQCRVLLNTSAEARTRSLPPVGAWRPLRGVAGNLRCAAACGSVALHRLQCLRAWLAGGVWNLRHCRGLAAAKSAPWPAPLRSVLRTERRELRASRAAWRAARAGLRPAFCGTSHTGRSVGATGDGPRSATAGPAAARGCPACCTSKQPLLSRH